MSADPRGSIVPGGHLLPWKLFPHYKGPAKVTAILEEGGENKRMQPEKGVCEK